MKDFWSRWNPFSFFQINFTLYQEQNAQIVPVNNLSMIKMDFQNSNMKDKGRD